MGQVIAFNGVFGGLFAAFLVVCVFSGKLYVRGAFGVFAAASVVGLVWNLMLPPMDVRVAQKPPASYPATTKPGKMQAVVYADRLRELIEEQSDARRNTARDPVGAEHESVPDRGGY